jgi:hypothetical protein
MLVTAINNAIAFSGKPNRQKKRTPKVFRSPRRQKLVNDPLKFVSWLAQLWPKVDYPSPRELPHLLRPDWRKKQDPMSEHGDANTLTPDQTNMYFDKFTRRIAFLREIPKKLLLTRGIKAPLIGGKKSKEAYDSLVEHIQKWLSLGTCQKIQRKFKSLIPEFKKQSSHDARLKLLADIKHTGDRRLNALSPTDRAWILEKILTVGSEPERVADELANHMVMERFDKKDIQRVRNTFIRCPEHFRFCGPGQNDQFYNEQTYPEKLEWWQTNFNPPDFIKGNNDDSDEEFV